jgi:N-acylneuraminate cytidylyltransferase
MKPVALILARKGSKRIPHKNRRDFCGAPLITWPISHAQKSGLFEAIVVSTDCETIAAIATEAGATAQMRPAHLADDHTGSLTVAAAVLADLKTPFDRPVCLLYGTSAFASPDRLQAGYGRLLAGGVDYAFAITPYPHPIERALSLDGRGHTRPIASEHEKTRTQDLPDRYHDTGQFYWGLAGSFMAQKPVLGGQNAGIVLPRSGVWDIDTPEDWAVAERIFEAIRGVA